MLLSVFESGLTERVETSLGEELVKSSQEAPGDMTGSSALLAFNTSMIVFVSAHYEGPIMPMREG